MGAGMGIGMWLFWIVIILVVVLVVKALAGNVSSSPDVIEEKPMDLLNKRLAAVR